MSYDSQASGRTRSSGRVDATQGVRGGRGGQTYEVHASETLMRGRSRSSRSLAFSSVNLRSFNSAIVCFFSLTAPAEWSAILRGCVLLEDWSVAKDQSPGGNWRYLRVVGVGGGGLEFSSELVAATRRWSVGGLRRCERNESGGTQGQEKQRGRRVS